MKKIIFMVLALLSSTMVMAQDSYTELMKQYMTLSQLSNEQAEAKALESFVTLAKTQGYSEDVAKSTATKFYNETMKPHILEMMTNCFKAYLSEDELKENIATFKTEAGQTALSHAQGIQSAEKQQKLQQILMPGIMSVLQGGQPTKVSAPECSESYKTKYAKYNDITNQTSMFTSLLDQIGQSLANVPGGNDLLVVLKNYINDNAANIMMNVSYPELTEQDLDFLINFYSTQAGQHTLLAIKDASSQSATYGMTAVQEYLDLLKKQ